MSAAPQLVEPRATPAAELRTSLGIAALSAALIHLMDALHGGAFTGFLAAAFLAGFAALLAFTPTRAVLAPAVAFAVVLTFGGTWFAAPAQLVLAGGALALLWGASDRALVCWSRAAFAVFALAAITGFGHLAH